jgi:hypothetical protein
MAPWYRFCPSRARARAHACAPHPTPPHPYRPLPLRPPPQESISASQQWFMACARFAPGMARMMAERAAVSRDADKQLHIIYLANDILFKALAARQLAAAAAAAAAAAGGPPPAPSAAAQAAEAALGAFGPYVGAMLAAAAKVAGDNTDQLLKVSRVLDFWGEKGVFDEGTLARVRREFGSKDATSALAAAGAAPAGFAPPPALAAAPAADGAAAGAAPAVVAPAYAYPGYPPGEGQKARGGWRGGDASHQSVL